MRTACFSSKIEAVVRGETIRDYPTCDDIEDRVWLHGIELVSLKSPAEIARN
jgi:hypothetical protein